VVADVDEIDPKTERCKDEAAIPISFCGDSSSVLTTRSIGANISHHGAVGVAWAQGGCGVWLRVGAASISAPVRPPAWETLF
jgi:hypothetical protein